MRYASRTDFVVSGIRAHLSTAGGNILDVGFIGEYDTPFLHQALLDNFSQSRIVGVDINDRINTFETGPNREYHQLSIFDLDDRPNFQRAFDIAVLGEVFEHLPQPYKALHHLNQCLKKGGLLVMTYPNPLGYKRFGRYLLQKDPLEGRFLKKYLGADDHKLFPMPPCLTAYLESIGFKVNQLAFLKGLPSRIPGLQKFSSYIGLTAIKEKDC